MSNYRGRRPETKVLPEIPSDVAGLYAILDRTNEPGDPELERYRVEDEAGIDIPSRADSVVRLLDHRFKGFRRERLEVLMRVFYSLNDYCFYREEHFDRVLIGPRSGPGHHCPSPSGRHTIVRDAAVAPGRPRPSPLLRPLAPGRGRHLCPLERGIGPGESRQTRHCSLATLGQYLTDP